jgi:ABC-type uncharacterized transport system permease subunit
VTPFGCVFSEGLALAAYLAAAVLYPQRLIRPDSRSTKYAHWALVIGAGLQGLGLLGHALIGQDHSSFGQFANLTFVLVLMITAGLLILEARSERPAVGAFLAPVIFLLVLLTVFEPQRSVATWQHPWFVGHMILIALAFACFGVAFCTAMAYFANDWFLKRKMVERLPLLPPLHVSERVTHVAVAVGFPLLTLGLGVGLAFMLSIGASPDATVVLASLIWVIYGAYLAFHNLGRLRGLRVQVLPVAGFAIVLLLLFFARHADQTLQSLNH